MNGLDRAVAQAKRILEGLTRGDIVIHAPPFHEPPLVVEIGAPLDSV